MYAGLLGALGRGAIGMATEAAGGAIANNLSKSRVKVPEDKEAGWKGYLSKAEDTTNEPGGKSGAEFKEYLGDNKDNGVNPYKFTDESGMERVNYKDMLEHLDKRDNKNFNRDARYAATVKLGDALGGNVSSSQWWGGYAQVPS